MTPNEKAERESFYGKRAIIDSLLLAENLDLNNYEIKMQAFKSERVLEVFLRAPMGEWRLLREFPFCNFSGKLGPKLKEGDLQIPEGIYRVAVFNPQSKFYLSLGLDYPNARDMLLADPSQPGSDIYIHGGCETVGCIPITNEKIAELYLLAKDAKEDIVVSIFPFKPGRENLQKYVAEFPQWETFWKALFAEAEITIPQ